MHSSAEMRRKDAHITRTSAKHLACSTRLAAATPADAPAHCNIPSPPTACPSARQSQTWRLRNNRRWTPPGPFHSSRKSAQTLRADPQTA